MVHYHSADTSQTHSAIHQSDHTNDQNYKGYDEISREIQELEQKISWNKKKITVLNDKKKNADSEKAKIIKEEIKDLRNEKKHNQQELDELKNLYKISDEIEEI